MSVEAPVGDRLDDPTAGTAVIRGGALRVSGFFAGTLIGVASFSLLARHLGVVDLGRYSIAVALVSLVGGFSDLGITTIGIREFSTRTGASRDLFARNVLGLRLAFATVGGIVMVIFAAGAGYGTTLVEGVALGALGLFLQTWQSTLAIPLMSNLRLGWMTAIDLTRAALGGVLIVALVLAGAGLLPFLAVSIPVGIAVLLVNALVVRGGSPLAPTFHLAAWRGLFGVVVPYALATAAAILYFQLALIVVSLIANPRTTAYFALSTRTVQVLIGIPGLAVSAALPIFARAAHNNRARLAYALGRVFETCLVLGVLISLVLGIGASLAIRVIGGPRFHPAAELLSIQAVGLAGSFVGSVWSYGLLSLGRYGDILRINLAALAFGGASVAVLVLIDGAQGAAIGTAAGEILLAMLNALALGRAERQLMPSFHTVPVVGLAAGLGVLTVFAGLPVVATCALASALYLAVVFTLGAVPNELVQHLRRRE